MSVQSADLHRAPMPLPAQERPVAIRTLLQRQSPRNARKHAIRHARRIATLYAADTLATLVAIATLQWWAIPGVSRFFDPFETHRISDAIGGGALFPAALFGLLLTGNYGDGRNRRDPNRIFRGVALAVTIAVWNPLWAGEAVSALVAAGIAVPLMFAAISLDRYVVDRAVRHSRRFQPGIPLVLVGEELECRKLVESRVLAHPSGYTVIGFITPTGGSGTDVLGSYEDLEDIISRRHVEAVAICGHVPDRVYADVVDVSLASNCELFALMRPLNTLGVRPSIRWNGPLALLDLTRPAFRAHELLLKRLLDIVLGVFFLIISAPVMVVVAIAIKLTSPGPIFFKQVRVGLGGKRFVIYKFRTMRPDAEALLDTLAASNVYSDRRLFKMERDPRVTRIGAFLRRSSLDELPQFFNVVRGDMSMVGPRPPTPDEVLLYEDHHFVRFDVKPGITGPWQVGGRNQIRDFEEVVRIEREYILNWSILNDLIIMARTVPAVLGMRGAF